ncbi:MAG: acyl-CoA reductase [Saprospiraceae bacterium]
MLTINQRIEIFEAWGKLCDVESDDVKMAIDRAMNQNAWFTAENCSLAVSSLQKGMLNLPKVKDWMAHYPLDNVKEAKTIGLTLAGNIPMVGMQDILCVLAAGHKAQVKLSEKDAVLIPYFIEKLIEKFPVLAQYVTFVDRLVGFDAIIATGSDNAARYFDFYFKKYPHIIRKNRNSMAILAGNESTDDLMELGKDVFQYFGLGCRNASFIWLPEGYEIPHLLDTWDPFHVLIHNNKFKNNFDYNCALYIMNGAKHYHSDYLVMLEQKRLASRIGVLNYAFYQDVAEIREFYQEQKDRIQCVVGMNEIEGIPVIPFGTSQEPGLYDYADGVDVMDFLLQLGNHA